MKKNQKFLVSFLSGIMLTSCQIKFTFLPSNSSTIASSQVNTSSSYNQSATPENGYHQDEKSISDTINYKALNKTSSIDALSSTKDQNILVIPFEFTDYPFVSVSRYSSEDQLDKDLDKALNGEGSTDTQFWESLSSFYKKSSFNNLNLTFEIAPIFKSSYSASSYISFAKTSTSEPTIYMLRDAVENYKAVNGNDSTKKYDTDGDGIIDSVMLIYSCHNATKDNKIKALDNASQYFWAYCYWDTEKTKSANKNSPIAVSYFWCSYDFLYSPDSCSIGGAVDSHIFCHETGHLLGLDDYYTYDSGCDYSRVGFADMMDGNYYDHDIFSKTALGWTKPYVITNSCTITIKPSQSNGDCIIFADDYNGYAFDEYMIMEFFTPDGLNERDSHIQYQNGYPIAFDAPGIKLYHVDARITSINNDGSGSYFEPKSNSSFNLLKNYQVAATNSTDRDLGAAKGKGFDLIKMINADKVNRKIGANSSMFHEGDQFTISDFSDQFPNRTKLNNGNSLPYRFTIDSISESEAVITFKHL